MRNYGKGLVWLRKAMGTVTASLMVLASAVPVYAFAESTSSTDMQTVETTDVETTDAETDVDAATDTVEAASDAATVMELTADNSADEGRAHDISATVTGDAAFSESDKLGVHELDADELDASLNELSGELDGQMIDDALLGFELDGVSGSLHARVGGDWVNNLDDYVMYHKADSGWQVVDYKVSGTEASFDADGLGTFVLVKASAAEDNVAVAVADDLVAFAVYSADDNSLSFYKYSMVSMPNAGSVFEGKTATAVYTGIESDTYTQSTVPWYDYRTEITSVYSYQFEAAPGAAVAGNVKIAPVSTAYWFCNCSSLTSLDLSGLDTGNVTNMSWMFYNCSSLTSLDVSGWDTGNVTSMRSMFYNCSSLTSLDASGWDTGNVTNMSYMFFYCSSLTSLDASGWDTGNVTDMSLMFSGCSKLTSLDASGWDTGNVTNMSYMFFYCSSLTSLDASGWDTGNVTDMSLMFSGCSKLTSLDASGWDTGNVTNMSYMFFYCSSLTSLDASGWDTGKVTNMSYMFYGCSALCKITIGPKTNLSKYTSSPFSNDVEWIKSSTGETVTGDTIRTACQSLSDGKVETFYRVVTIAFNHNGGVGGSTSWTGSLAETYTTDLVADPVRTGYTFGGWYTAAQGGTRLEAGAQLAQTTYWAHWTSNSYTLKLSPGNGSGDEKSVAMRYDETYQLSDDIYERDGYVLSGWNTRRNGSGDSYAANAAVANLASEAESEVTLYAQWTPASEYAWVTFDSNGGADVETKRYTKGKTLGRLPVPERAHATFVCWHVDSVDGPYASGLDKITGDMTLVAEWHVDPVITFVNGFSDNTQRRIGWGRPVGTLPSFGINANNYMTLIGWVDEAGNEVTSATTFTADATLTARWGWAPKFVTNGGKYAEGSSGTAEIRSTSSYKLDTLPAVTRDGYEFVGWYLADGTTKVTAGDTVDLTKGIEIAAKWKKITTHRVTLDMGKAPNGTSMSSVTYAGSKDFELADGVALFGLGTPSYASQINGKYVVFAGWADASGRTWKNGDEVTGDLALTAQWAWKDVTVTFDPCGGTMSSKTQTVAAGSTLNTLPGAKKSNYVFRGWYTAKDGQGDKLTTDTVIGSNITYYAYYEAFLDSGEADGFTYSFGAEWGNASNTDVDNVNDVLEWHPSTTGTKTSTLHVRYELDKTASGETLPVGAVQITIPKYIFKDTDGNDVGTNNVSAALPKWPNTKSNMYFSYVDDGDTYILKNNVALAGGTGVDVQITYSVDPTKVPGGATDAAGNYVDGYEYYSGQVPVSVTVDTDADGAADSTAEKTLSVEMHTKASATPSVEYWQQTYGWSSAWGEKPADADQYFYIVWRTTRAVPTNQTQSSTHSWSFDDAYHDGTLVEFSENTSSEWSNGSRLYRGYAVMKYPISMLADCPSTGIELSMAATLNLDWKSGYEVRTPATATTTVYAPSYPSGTFGKNNNRSDGAASTVSGGQDDIVFDKKGVSMTWNLTYQGASRDTDVTWDDKAGTYTARERTIELTDGDAGDVMYSSGSAAAKYVWEPAGGNYALSDDEYRITRLNFSLTEYDASKVDGMWTDPVVSGTSNDYNGWRLYLRYAGSSDYVYYGAVAPQADWSLPDGVVGYKVQHDTDYYSTSLQVTGTFTILPSARLQSFVSADMSAKATSIIKDKSTCRIWNTDESVDKAFYTVTDYRGGSNAANKECYELTASKINQRTRAFAASESSVVFDSGRGTQDSPMEIVGYNYDESRYKKVTSGVFYDLLPAGTTVDASTVFCVPMTQKNADPVNECGSYASLKTGSTLSSSLFDVSFEENYKDSGRTMMTVKWNVPDDGTTYTGMKCFFMLHNTYDNIVSCGTTAENDVAFVNTSGLATPDTLQYGVETIAAADVFADIQKANAGVVSYDAASTSYVPVAAFSWGFDKTVSGESSEFTASDKALAGNDYTYKLTYNQSDTATSNSITFFDVLEAGGEDADGGALESAWHGTLKSVDVSSAASKLTKGSDTDYCAPVVYYSTKDRSKFSAADYDVTNSATWSETAPADMSKVTAIAVSLAKTASGADFVLDGRESVSINVTMTAPSDTALAGSRAYNTAQVSSKKDTDETATSLVSQASVELAWVTPEIHKRADPESGTVDEPTPVFKDSTLDYVVTVKNPSDEIGLANVTVEDALSSALSIDTAAIRVKFADSDEWVRLSDSPRVSLAKETTTDADNPQKLTFTIGSLYAGETCYIKVPTVNLAESGLITNTAHVTKVGRVGTDVSSETTYHEGDYYDAFTATLKKVDALTGKALAGATLELTGRDVYSASDMEPITWVTDGSDKTVELYPGNYTLTEVEAPSGYAIADPVSFYIGADKTVTMYDAPATSVTVEKKWNDGDGDGRPESVEMTLLRDGKAYRDVQITAADGWEKTIEGLPACTADGKDYTYTVEEKPVEGYAASYSDDGFTVTNTKTVTVAGKKVWSGIDAVSAPAVTMRLINQLGEEVATQEVSAKTGWAYSFTVPAYAEDGSAITYQVKEAYLDGYRVTYGHQDVCGLRITMDVQTESTSYDWVYVYYEKDGTIYRSATYGGSAKKTVVVDVPATSFWVEFKSDDSQCSYYGFKVCGVEALESEPAGFTTVATLPSGYSQTEVTDPTTMETEHGNYGNNKKLRWHYDGSGDYAGGDVVTNTKLDKKAATYVTLAKVDGTGAGLAGAHMQLLDSAGEVVYDWVSETDPEELCGLAAGTYTLHEVTAPAGYKVAADKQIDVADKAEPQAFTFVNTKGCDLSVTKQVEGTLADKDKEFEFTVTLEGDEVPGTITFERSDGWSDSYEPTDGKFTFTLSDGQTMTITGLPSGVKYSVVEETYSDYEATYSEGASGTLGDDDVEVVVTNTYVTSARLPETGSYALVWLATLAAAAIACALRLRRHA